MGSEKMSGPATGCCAENVGQYAGTKAQRLEVWVRQVNRMFRGVFSMKVLSSMMPTIRMWHAVLSLSMVSGACYKSISLRPDVVRNVFINVSPCTFLL